MTAELDKDAKASAATSGIRGILTTLGPRSRALALVLFVVDSIFGASIFSTAALSHVSNTAFIVAVICLTVILLASLAAITTVELIVERGNHSAMSLKPSPHTPSSEVLDGLVNSTLEAICRATSLPLAPDVARMRAFIFKIENDQLVCRYFWALNPTSEQVGITKFPYEKKFANDVVVVRAAFSGKVEKTAVQPLPPDLESASSKTIDRSLTFVLAAPIFDEDGKVWGTVDFDTSNEMGHERLVTDLADAAIFQLSKHLQAMFSLNMFRQTAMVTA